MAVVFKSDLIHFNFQTMMRFQVVGKQSWPKMSSVEEKNQAKDATGAGWYETHLHRF